MKRSLCHLLLGAVFLIISMGFAGCDLGQSVPETELPAGDITTSTHDVAEVVPPSPTQAEIEEEPTLGVGETEQQNPTLLPVEGTAISTPLVQVYPIMGIEMHTIDQRGGLDLVNHSSADWVRRNALLWSQVEPQMGMRDWDAVTDLEDELVNAAEEGLEVILIVRSTPNWAQKVPGYSCGPVSLDKLTAFAVFMRDTVARYSVPPYNVKYFEIWNEPDIAPHYVDPNNIFGCWGDEYSPFYGGDYYAEMLKIVYPQVKNANPDAQVLVGGLLLDCDPLNPPLITSGSSEKKDCSPSRFLEGILQNGGGNFFDGVSFHAYDFYSGPYSYSNSNWQSIWDVDGPVVSAKADYLRNLLTAFGFGNKFLMNTESGLLCGRDGKEPACLADEFQFTKAYYAAQANATAMALGLRANVWYSLTGWRGTALVDNSLQPYPAYNSLSFSATKLHGSMYNGEIDQYPGVKGYEFERDGTRIWFLWSLDGEEHSVQFSTAPSAVFDVFGMPVNTTQEFMVTRAPVYIEWTS
jgi:hypothetical protein